MIDDAATEIVNAPEKFRGYLDTQARMDRYSAANALLIYKQQPQATQLKEFRDWQEDGVKVSKGAKSLSILEPVEYAKKDGSTGIAYNVKKVFDVSQTNGRRPAAPTLDRDPRKLVAVMLDTAPIDVATVEELPSPNMGAFYRNEDQTLYVKRDIGDSVALCQCVAQELGHAQLAMSCEAYSRREMGFSAALRLSRVRLSPLSAMQCALYSNSANIVWRNTVVRKCWSSEPISAICACLLPAYCSRRYSESRISLQVEATSATKIV